MTAEAAPFDWGSLPRKRVAAAALFFDQAGQVLIVKPTYRPEWLLPGGSVEPAESPLAGCLREVQEELGLDVRLGRLLCVDWSIPLPDRDDAIVFIFDGGVLTSEQTAAIRLPSDELSEHRFVAREEALALLADKLSKRIAYCLANYQTRGTEYLEDGQPQPR